HAHLRDVRIDVQAAAGGGVAAFAGDADVVERQLEVLAPVPVHADGPGVHGAAGNARHGGGAGHVAEIVQVEVVVAQAELPQPGAAVAALAGARHAVAVAPAFAGQVPKHRGVAAACVEVRFQLPLHGGPEPFGLQLQRPAVPHRLGADGGLAS